MSRRARLVLLAFCALLFVGISIVLGRVLSGDGAERSAVVAVIQREAGGNAPALLALLPRCARSSSCRARQTLNAARLRRAGPVQILRFDSSGSLALTTRTAAARIAWRTPSTLSIVQCVRVRRRGAFAAGPSATVLDLSAPVGREASCG